MVGFVCGGYTPIARMHYDQRAEPGRHWKGSNIMCGDQSDHVLQHWTVDISIDEHEGLTRAKARLRWREKELVGVGLARLNPADRNVPEIGDELSVARALSDLGSEC